MMMRMLRTTVMRPWATALTAALAFSLIGCSKQFDSGPVTAERIELDGISLDRPVRVDVTLSGQGQPNYDSTALQQLSAQGVESQITTQTGGTGATATWRLTLSKTGQFTKAQLADFVNQSRNVASQASQVTWKLTQSGAQ